MGAWNLIISGIGPHHNGHAADADAVFSSIVAKMQEAGHTIHSAVLGHTGDAKHDLIAAPTHNTITTMTVDVPPVPSAGTAPTPNAEQPAT